MATRRGGAWRIFTLETWSLFPAYVLHTRCDVQRPRFFQRQHCLEQRFCKSDGLSPPTVFYMSVFGWSGRFPRFESKRSRSIQFAPCSGIRLDRCVFAQLSASENLFVTGHLPWHGPMPDYSWPARNQGLDSGRSHTPGLQAPFSQAAHKLYRYCCMPRRFLASV